MPGPIRIPVASLQGCLLGSHPECTKSRLQGYLEAGLQRDGRSWSKTARMRQRQRKRTPMGSIRTLSNRQNLRAIRARQSQSWTEIVNLFFVQSLDFSRYQ